MVLQVHPRRFRSRLFFTLVQLLSNGNSIHDNLKPQKFEEKARESARFALVLDFGVEEQRKTRGLGIRLGRIRGVERYRQKEMGYVMSTPLHVTFNADSYLLDVTIVSANSYFNFTPLLASCAVGTLEFRCAVEPVSFSANL